MARAVAPDFVPLVHAELVDGRIAKLRCVDTGKWIGLDGEHVERPAPMTTAESMEAVCKHLHACTRVTH